MMKRLVLSLAILFLLSTNASAASKFWVGGGTNTNWNSSPTTNWANSSGGAGNQTAPTTGDDVFFDANSGTGAANLNVAISLSSFIMTGSRNTITLSGVAITISVGDFLVPTGVGGTFNLAGTPSLIFTGTSGTQHITSGGFTLPNLTFNGVGGTFQFQDNVITTTNSGGITLTNGTLDTQSFTVSSQTFSSNNSNVRVLKGSGNWTVGTGNVSGAIWSATPSTNLDVSLFTGTIIYVG